MSLDPAWIAFISTGVGTIGLAVINHVLSNRKEKSDYATQMREELRDEIKIRKEEIEALEREVDEWRTKYYDVRDELMKVSIDLRLALHNIHLETPDVKNGE